MSYYLVLADEGIVEMVVGPFDTEDAATDFDRIAHTWAFGDQYDEGVVIKASSPDEFLQTCAEMQEYILGEGAPPPS